MRSFGRQVEIYSSRCADCRQDFHVGQRYLVYADRRPDGRSFATCCHRGGSIEERGIPSGRPRGPDDVQDGTTLEMEELDRLAAPSATSAATRDADEIRALWDRYVSAIRSGEASEAAAAHCPEMTVLFERWRDLALYESKEGLFELHIQELLTEAQGFTDDGNAISGVPIPFRRLDDRWCYGKAASILNTFSQPDNMRLAIEQMATSEGKSLAEMIEKSIPGDSVWPVEVDSTIWEPLLRRPQP